MKIKSMKIIVVGIAVCLFITTPKVDAQNPIAEVIKQGVTKVIKAVDLKVQRLQNKTIWLQNAQKVIENSMSQLHLNEITDWVTKQKDLYGEYYQSLSKVKSLIALYQGVKDISVKQAQLMNDYKHAWNTLRQDKHFSADELTYMADVYNGILGETIKNADGLLLVVNSFTTQMSDAERLQIINGVAESVDENYTDLHQFNNQNAILSLQRAKGTDEIQMVKAMYGL